MANRNCAWHFAKHSLARAAIILVAAWQGPLTFAQAVVIPDFLGIPSQQPSGAIVSDPTVRPMLAPGQPASIFAMRPIDFQGNGRADLFACYGVGPPSPPQKMPCRVLRPQSDGSLVDVTRALFGNGALPGAIGPKTIVVADFNKDGRPDIYVGSSGWDASPFAGEVGVLLISNADGTYSDRSSTLPQTPAFTHDACVGDVNGDGNLDIYVGNISSQSNVGPYFLMGNGDGTFVQSTNRLPAQIANTLEKFTACALVDVDQDGSLDLVLGTHGDGGFLKSIILFNNGSGDFTVRPRYELPPGPLGEGNTVVQGIGVLDINQDGEPDLILTSSQSATFSGFGIQMLINQGGGTFTDESAARLGSSFMRMTGSPFQAPRFADMNGDGYMDFYFSNGPRENVNRYWINNGDGTFYAVPPGQYTQGENFGVSAVYFDSDSRVDLVQISHYSLGDVHYMTFLNAGPRTVPSEPVIGVAVAGDSLAAIFFSTPVSKSAITITSYTASCRHGSVPVIYSASGTSSPITVSGLANGIPYSCSVRANSAAGSGLPSETVNVLPSMSAPLALLAVKSRKSHGPAGVFDIPIDYTIPNGGPVSIEPRSVGNGHSVVFQFNSAVNSFAPIAVVDEATTTLPAIPSTTGSELVVTLPQLPDNKRVTISLPTINGISLNKSVTLGFLVGDVTGSRLVSAADISAVKANMNKTVDAETCRFDVSLSGSINSSDLSMVKAKAGQVLP